MHNLNFMFSGAMSHDAVAEIQQPISVMQASHPQQQSQNQSANNYTRQKLVCNPTEQRQPTNR